MKGEEEFFPRGVVWYCDQCKLVDGLEVSVWVDPNEPEVSHLNTVVLGGYEGWCHNCDDEVVVKQDLPPTKSKPSPVDAEASTDNNVAKEV
tara:strand:- start:2038 stop:2310 length:273 start_codon:yes stop_codon:yes gene_type:complete